MNNKSRLDDTQEQERVNKFSSLENNANTLQRQKDLNPAVHQIHVSLHFAGDKNMNDDLNTPNSSKFEALPYGLGLNKIPY